MDRERITNPRHRLFFKNKDGGVHVVQADCEIPTSWQGGTVKQFLNSARAITDETRPSSDPRRRAAGFILTRFGKESKGGEKR